METIFWQKEQDFFWELRRKNDWNMENDGARRYKMNLRKEVKAISSSSSQSSSSKSLEELKTSAGPSSKPIKSGAVVLLPPQLLFPPQLPMG